MEAAVQRDPNNAQAWFQLGVKQQENEREAKAIHALRRALELDPTHLPSWVALAISHTNEGNRNGSCESIREWITHNERYREAVMAYRMQRPERDDMTQSEKFNDLIDCLITMSQTPGIEEIDADIQIALAVLMNTNEVSAVLFQLSSETHACTGLRPRQRLFLSCIGHETRCKFRILREGV